MWAAPGCAMVTRQPFTGTNSGQWTFCVNPVRERGGRTAGSSAPSQFYGPKISVKTPAKNADIAMVRQHCAQCLTEVLAGGYDTPTGETLCGPCDFALWGPRANGDRLASTTERRRPRSRRPAKPKSHWIGPTFEVSTPASAVGQGIWRPRV
jgi:hypothetical protein